MHPFEVLVQKNSNLVIDLHFWSKTCKACLCRHVITSFKCFSGPKMMTSPNRLDLDQSVLVRGSLIIIVRQGMYRWFWNKRPLWFDNQSCGKNNTLPNNRQIISYKLFKVNEVILIKCHRVLPLFYQDFARFLPSLMCNPLYKIQFILIDGSLKRLIMTI